MKRIHGTWSPRLAELKLNNELLLQKSADDLRTYQLTDLRKLVLGAGKNSLHAKMTLADGEKLYLKMRGPDRSEWARRMTQCKFPMEKTEIWGVEESPAKFIRPPSTPVSKPEAIIIAPNSFVDVYDSEALTSSYAGTEHNSVTGTNSSISTVSMQSTDIENHLLPEPQKEDGEEEEDGLITRLARVYEPHFISRRATMRLCRKK